MLERFVDMHETVERLRGSRAADTSTALRSTCMRRDIVDTPSTSIASRQCIFAHGRGEGS